MTPGIKQDLIKHALGKSVAIVDIFDMERLRHVLDTPEGLLVRLQYLDIPMTASEQAALVGKYGSQLQNAVTARFDRVERTLAQMERFLDLQKPLYRLDFYFQLVAPSTSSSIGNEAVLLILHGLHDISGKFFCLCMNKFDHPGAGGSLTMSTQMWNKDQPGNVLTLPQSVSFMPHVLTTFSQLSLTMGGHRVRLADLSAISLEAICTEGFRSRIRSLAVDANGYALFDYFADGQGEVGSIPWAPNLAITPSEHKWVNVLTRKDRDLLFLPPARSPRLFLPLQQIPVPVGN